MQPALPTVLATSVIRSTFHGESHGGIYLIDLQTQECEQVVDWNDTKINWEGRGADRGLRGIAFYDDLILVAASDEVFVYDRSFELVDSFRNRYLDHCHEIHRSDDLLWLTSTGFDAVLGVDLKTGRFSSGYHVDRTYPNAISRRAASLPRYSARHFDPEAAGGPSAKDTLHINNTWMHNGHLLVSGTGLRHLVEITDGHTRPFARVPAGTHNAQPFRDGVLVNHTAGNRIAYLRRSGRSIGSFPIKTYRDDDLLFSAVPTDHARQAFGRGLCTWDGRILIGGSSPATISAFDLATGTRIRCINITMDVRNAIHGLEVWPY